MPIYLHNTLTRQREEFVPIDPNNVCMYVCGPTVYDFAHLGNAVPVVFFDILFRLLRHTYGAEHITYARNYTDIDDKIMNRAKERGEEIDVLTKRYEAAFEADMVDGLGTLLPTHILRATAHIPQMIAMIEQLIARGHAYEAAPGEVLFHVPSMPNYGRLSRHSREDLIDGARVDVASYKKDPADFTLWKPSTSGQPGWNSPWGRGRPGWHIECSAMSEEHLGETFDIHAGGGDLLFPHHENEIAQSECAHGGKTMANYWLHNGMLQVEGRRMGKSEGNFITVNELIKDAPGEAIRFSLLKSHYRSPINFSQAGFKQAKTELDGLYRRVQQATGEGQVSETLIEALSNDLNTPLAISLLHQVTDDDLKASAAVLGILQQDPDEWFKWQPQNAEVDPSYIEQQIAARLDARSRRDFTESDRIRDALAGQGIILEDSKDGTTWRRS